MTRFPRYAASRGSWGVAKVPTVVVEVEQDDGLDSGSIGHGLVWIDRLVEYLSVQEAIQQIKYFRDK